jgi:hypothetical protein
MLAFSEGHHKFRLALPLRLRKAISFWASGNKSNRVMALKPYLETTADFDRFGLG